MNILAALLIASSIFGPAFTTQPKVNSKDLQRLTGTQWQGTLTYLDYRSNKKVSIPSHLTVIRSVEDKFSWVFEYQYPDEPKANSKDTVTISRDGRVIDGESVIERSSLGGDTTRIVTEKKGMDNDKSALFHYTYLIGASSLSIKKEVRYDGATEFIERNQFNWKR
ncbi:MAG: hypothetical protein ABI967_14175 [bacterium]